MSVRRGPNKGAWILSKKMDIHYAAYVGDLSALKDAIKRGEDVNSVKVYKLVCGYVELKL